MYTTDHSFLVLPIKDLINKDGDPIMPFKLATGTKNSVSHLCVLLFPCVVRKATVHIDTKALNMCHQAQKVFYSISVGIPQHQKWYLVFVPGIRKIMFLCDVVFDESFSSSLAYTSQSYAEGMAMYPSISYTPYDTSSRGELAI